MVYTSEIRYNFSSFTYEWFPFYKLQDFFFQFLNFKISLWVADKPTNSLLKRAYLFFFLDGKMEENIISHWNWNTTEPEKERNYSKSSLRICRIQGGEVPFQILVWPEIFASLAKVWAALLPSHFRWWKKH